MNDIVLEVKSRTRRFGAFTAVDGLTLSVNAGEVFGLLGSNSVGKITTIKMLILLTTTVLVFLGARLYPRLAS